MLLHSIKCEGGSQRRLRRTLECESEHNSDDA